MSTYVMADLHGCYKSYMTMLDKIGFSDEDDLYIVGDIVDRGPNPIKIILDTMKRENVFVLIGNHEVMAVECMKFLLDEITDESISALDKNTIIEFNAWLENGGSSTITELHSYDKHIRKEIFNYLINLDVYEELEINNKEFILVHAGLGNFKSDKPIWEYELDELVWERADYSKQYYYDKYVITGHTPTFFIEANENPGYIFKSNNHIAIDCGCSSSSGRLACLRLEDMQEFYVESSEFL